MKIVFLLCSPDINGGTNVILEHAGGLQRLGHEVTIATQEEVAPSRYAWHRAGTLLTWRTLEELQGQTFDFAIATWWESPYLLSKIEATHCVYFVQSIESKFFPAEDPKSLDTRDHSLGVCRCDNGYYFSLPIITEAAWIKEFLEIQYNHQPYLVRNGIRKEIYLDEAVIVPRRKGALRVLIEGPIDVFHKNVPKTVELCRKAGVAEIWLLTSSPVASFSGVDRVFSQIPFDRTPPIYRSCDVLVKLSYVEGMFGPPLEMFHCGGTAIVYDVNGHDEYIRHGSNALVLARDDEQGIIDALNALKTNEDLLASLCREACITAAEWPDWAEATKQFAAALEVISQSKPVSRTYLQNITDTFNAYQLLQLQSRELARFAQREQDAADVPGTFDNFVELYGETLVRQPNVPLWVHYRCGARVVLQIPAQIQGKHLQLRIDPSVRIGIIKLYSLRILAQPEGRDIADFQPKSGFEQLYLTGTAKWLERHDDHWVIESFGNDPQLVLPQLELPAHVVKILVEVSLHEVGMSEYSGDRGKNFAHCQYRSKWTRFLGKLGILTCFVLLFCWKAYAGNLYFLIFDTYDSTTEVKADITKCLVKAIDLGPGETC